MAADDSDLDSESALKRKKGDTDAGSRKKTRKCCHCLSEPNSALNRRCVQVRANLTLKWNTKRNVRSDRVWLTLTGRLLVGHADVKQL